MSGPFTAAAAATPNPGTRAAIDSVDFQVEGPSGWESVSRDGDAPWAAEVDLTAEPEPRATAPETVGPADGPAAGP